MTGLILGYSSESRALLAECRGPSNHMILPRGCYESSSKDQQWGSAALRCEMILIFNVLNAESYCKVDYANGRLASFISFEIKSSRWNCFVEIVASIYGCSAYIVAPSSSQCSVNSHYISRLCDPLKDMKITLYMSSSYIDASSALKFQFNWHVIPGLCPV